MKKILIVENELLQTYFLKRVMKYFNYDVIGSAAKGERAIELATELQPDIVLMDINLDGDLNGVETATQILKKVDCFIIYITGNSDETLLKQARQSQSGIILSKPITGERIKTAIDSYLNTTD